VSSICHIESPALNFGGNALDFLVFSWFNQWNGSNPQLDLLIRIAQSRLIRTLPYMLVFWALWFWWTDPVARRQARNALVATLVLMVVIIGVTRAFANFAPFSARPIHTPGLDINLRPGQSGAALDGWSSMPSDHASLFIGLAVAFLLIHRGFGLVMIAWAILFTTLPRVVLGLHWPSDVLVGGVLGATISLVFLRPLTRLVERSGIVPFFEKREAIGYALLFFVTYEAAHMFSTARQVVSILF
jgi:undecaprenyl-diphosphatase